MRDHAQTRPVLPILRRARALIVTGGWAQGHYETRRGRCCLVGALFKAAGLDPHCSLLGGKLLAPLGFASEDAALQWNDGKECSKQDVVDRLTAAIEKQAAVEAA